MHTPLLGAHAAIWPQTSFVVIAGNTSTNRHFDSACIATNQNCSTDAAGCASTEHTFVSIYGASSRCGVDTECDTATFDRGATVHSITTFGTHSVSDVGFNPSGNKHGSSTRAIGKHAPTTSSGHAWTEFTPRVACIFVHHASSSTSTSSA
jgi:hypothetical protein